jgi:hypothetical protein
MSDMKRIYKTGIWILFILISISQWNCAKENEEFIYTHDTNLITQMVCKASQSSGEFRAEIYEFNKDGVMVEEGFTQQDVEGGYGLILFPISKSMENDVDLKNMILRATVTYDVIITPTLSGRHDISGEGMIITVESGEKTKRQYRVRGYFE